jgi:hypothetical protein
MVYWGYVREGNPDVRRQTNLPPYVFVAAAALSERRREA